MLKLAIVATHPVQYTAPIYRQLAGQCALKVFYAFKPSDQKQGEGFGVPFQWDVDLLSGYASQVVGDAVVEALSQEKWDAILLMGWNHPVFFKAMSIAAKTQTPLLVRGDSMLLTPAPFFKKIVREFTHRRLMSRFSVCLAVGKRSEDYFHHFGAKKIIRSPHCVDNAAFAALSQKARSCRTEIRKRWNIPSDAFVVLYAGKFEAKKRPLDFLSAVSKAQRPDLFALMVGDGALKKAAQAFAAEHRISSAFTGFLNQTQIPEAYAAADLLVLCSDARETWGLVVNEAMACGLPVLVTRESGCSVDLVEEGKNGFVFTCGDVAALAGQLRSLTPSQAQEMGRVSAEKITGYSVERAASGILEAAKGAR